MDYRTSHLDRGSTYDATLAASPWDAYMARWEARHVTEIVHALFPQGVQRYLDFACGTGRMTSVIMPFAKETIGVDVSSSMLEVARGKLTGATLIQADLTRVESDIGLFDLASSFRFFGNAEQGLRAMALKAIHRVLKPDGLLLLNSHRNPACLANILHRLTGGKVDMDLSYRVLKQLLWAAGFDIVDAKPIGAWMCRAAWMQRRDRTSDLERRLERAFGSRVWVPVAPDAIILARKVRRSN